MQNSATVFIFGAYLFWHVIAEVFWVLFPNPIFAISPVAVWICTILQSTVILLECICFVITDCAYQLVNPRKTTERYMLRQYLHISMSSSLLGFQIHILPYKYVHMHTHTYTQRSLGSRPSTFWLWNSGHPWVTVGFFLDAEGLHQLLSFIFIFDVLLPSEEKKVIELNQKEKSETVWDCFVINTLDFNCNLLFH